MKKSVLALLLCSFICSGTVYAQDMGVEEERFYVSGFIDMMYKYYNIKYPGSSVFTFFPNVKDNNGYFIQNRLNLYFGFNIDKDWKAFTEIRFLYTPSDTRTYFPGSSYGLTGDFYLQYQENDTSDQTGTRYKYGSIYIERAYIDWTHFQWASLRAGRFFTPFGIFNLDHGSPIITSVRLPFIVAPTSDEVGMPTTQTGLEAFGRVRVPGNVTLEYAAFVGNGINNSDANLDVADNNKAVGGWLNIKLPTLFNMVDCELGASTYYGKRSYIWFAGAERLGSGFVADYDETKYSIKQTDTMALTHAKISIRNLPLDGVLILQTEGLVQWVEEDQGSDLVIQAGPTFMERDYRKKYRYTTCYGQAEYQMFGMITPYFRFEFEKTGTTDQAILSFRETTHQYIVGLNFKPVPRIAIKCEYLYSDAYVPVMTTDPDGPGPTPAYKYSFNNDYWAIQASVSAAF